MDPFSLKYSNYVKSNRMRRLFSVSTISLCLAILSYAVVSKLIFDNIYLTSKQVIDEEFHLPQGLAYCYFHFDSWNPKITTLPGLYIVSAFFLAPFNLCLIYWLRFVNLAASVLNLVLFYILLGLYNKKMIAWKKLLSSVNLALLPPLYFFSHLYYTDTISLTFVLLLFIFEKREYHTLASLAGMASVIMRQTNIIWVLMVFGRYVVVHTVHKLLKRKSKNKNVLGISEEDLLELKNKRITIRNFTLEEWVDICNYLILLFTFAFFVFLNGDIVVGDKTAHVPAIHIPQIFYFSLFCLIFMWPYFVPKVFEFLRIALKWKFTIAILLAVFSVIVYCNTMVHPYLLADNRHYTFYIWHRLYGKYFFARYAMIFCYIFSMYCMGSIIYRSYDVSFAAVYVPCTLVVLVLQRMIEVRYFLVPYILLRLNVSEVCFKQLICEFVFFFVINYLTLDIFFTKNIYWVDYRQPQKLIW